MPLIVGFNLVQYAQIPGETVVADPLPAGPIPSNCRILFCIENKGRTPLRMIELCIENICWSRFAKPTELRACNSMAFGT